MFDRLPCIKAVPTTLDGLAQNALGCNETEADTTRFAMPPQNRLGGPRDHIVPEDWLSRYMTKQLICSSELTLLIIQPPL